MSDADGDDTPRPAASPPPPVHVRESWHGPDGPIHHTARAEWVVLRKDDEAIAEVFSVAYVADPPPDLPEDAPNDRPVTFVMNGGPGASSVYLHLGAVGPRRVAFAEDGSTLPPPSRLVDNAESWLAFTDLVFVDPVGTGFSRVIDHGTRREPSAGTSTSSTGSGAEAGAADGPDPRAFFGVDRDLDSLGEFVTRWLSTHGRWGSPVLLAGESYGGFRGAKLVRRLVEKFGVGLSGVVLISPALEFATLDPTDYDVLAWVDLLPTMAAAAVHHGRSRTFAADTPLDEVLRGANQFATGRYASALIRGAAMPAEDHDAVMVDLADMVGLDADLVRRAEGRIGIRTFARELLRDEGRTLGLYDASTSVRDPFPDRDPFAGPDPSLAGIERVFAAGINQRLRGELGVQTDRPYELLSMDVNKSWKVDLDRHALDGPIGATDDLRHGMALDPSVRVLISHGHYDLVTPFQSSERLRNLMRLDPETASRIGSRHFTGGHMFYAWDRSRREFRDVVADFYAAAVQL
jgi:carboxypeptidase C (cathepsin A)